MHRTQLVARGILIVLSAGVAFAQEAAQPKLTLSQPSWDFGKAWHPEPRSMVLTLHNEGTGELRIEEVRSTCGCTVAQPATNRVAPGGSTTVNVKFDTHGKQGDVSSKVIIKSNDPKRREVQFPIKGFVLRAVTRDPLGGFGVRALDGKPGLVGTLKLENQTDQPMDLKLKSNTLSALDIEIREVTPGLSYEVVGRTNRQLDEGQYRGAMIFTTGLDREPTLNITATIRIFSVVQPSPGAIYLRKGDEKPVTRRIMVQYYGQSDNFKVLGAKCDHPLINVKLGPVQEPYAGLKKMQPPMKKMCYVTAELPEPSKIPDAGSIIEIRTNDPEVPLMKVLVTTDKVAWQGIMYGTNPLPAN